MTQLDFLSTPIPPLNPNLITWLQTKAAFYDRTIAILAASQHPHREYEIGRLQAMKAEVLEKIGGKACARS